MRFFLADLYMTHFDHPPSPCVGSCPLAFQFEGKGIHCLNTLAHAHIRPPLSLASSLPLVCWALRQTRMHESTNQPPWALFWRFRALVLSFCLSMCVPHTWSSHTLLTAQFSSGPYAKILSLADKIAIQSIQNKVCGLKMGLSGVKPRGGHDTQKSIPQPYSQSHDFSSSGADINY